MKIMETMKRQMQGYMGLLLLMLVIIGGCKKNGNPRTDPSIINQKDRKSLMLNKTFLCSVTMDEKNNGLNYPDCIGSDGEKFTFKEGFNMEVYPTPYGECKDGKVDLKGVYQFYNDNTLLVLNYNEKEFRYEIKTFQNYGDKILMELKEVRDGKVYIKQFISQ